MRAEAQIESIKSPCQARLVNLLLWCLLPPPFSQKILAQMPDVSNQPRMFCISKVLELTDLYPQEAQSL